MGMNPTQPLSTVIQSPRAYPISSYIGNTSPIASQVPSSSGFLLPSQLRNSKTISHTVPLKIESSFIPQNPIVTPPPLRP
jgi:hypothetical protein